MNIRMKVILHIVVGVGEPMVQGVSIALYLIVVYKDVGGCIMCEVWSAWSLCVTSVHSQLPEMHAGWPSL